MGTLKILSLVLPICYLLTNSNVYMSTFPFGVFNLLRNIMSTFLTVISHQEIYPFNSIYAITELRSLCEFACSYIKYTFNTRYTNLFDNKKYNNKILQ